MGMSQVGIMERAFQAWRARDVAEKGCMEDPVSPQQSEQKTRRGQWRQTLRCLLPGCGVQAEKPQNLTPVLKGIPLAALFVTVCKIRNAESRCGETAKFQGRGNVAWNGLTARK